MQFFLTYVKKKNSDISIFHYAYWNVIQPLSYCGRFASLFETSLLLVLFICIVL